MEQLRVNVRMDLFENIVKAHGEKNICPSFTNICKNPISCSNPCIQTHPYVIFVFLYIYIYMCVSTLPISIDCPCCG